MLREEIMRAIEKEAMRTGKMGTEPVEAIVYLTREEKEQFLSMDDFDSDHYTWEFDDMIDGKLYISFTEEV